MNTLGPWQVLGPYVCTATEPPLHIAMPDGNKRMTDSERVSNAHLIAAAPELLEIAKRTVAFLDLFEEVSEQAFGGWAWLRDDAKAIIAKTSAR